MESSEENRPLPPHSPFAVAAIFWFFFTLVRQCSSFTCQLQCESNQIPCLCSGLLFLMAALVKKKRRLIIIGEKGREKSFCL